jgi:CO dehydrogenase maturation factor
MKLSVCGKGGSGKSTVVCLLSAAAQNKGLKTLVVDSDESNSGLFRMLGFEKPPIPLMTLVGGKEGIREKMSQTSILSEKDITLEKIPHPYINKQDGLWMVSIGKIHQALEGCACPMGALSREFLNKLCLGENEIAIADMEAGVEHFGRGLDAGIDSVVLVVEPSYESLALSGKIKDLAKDMQKSVWAVLNKIDSENLGAKLEKELKNRDIETIGAISYDPVIFSAGLTGKPVRHVESIRKAEKILNRLLSKIAKNKSRE